MEEEFRLLTLQIIGEAILSLPPDECDRVFPHLYLPVRGRRGGRGACASAGWGWGGGGAGATRLPAWHTTTLSVAPPHPITHPLHHPPPNR